LSRRVPVRIPPIIPIRLFGPRGSKDVDALVDTGSTYVIVSPEDARDLGYKPSARVIPIATAGGIVHAPFLRLHAVEALGFRQQRIPALIKDITASGIEAILGWSFLNQYRLTIHATRHWLELARQ